MSSEECPVCKDWGPGTFQGYVRANGHGCPRCGSDGKDRDMALWLRAQVEADLERFRAVVVQLEPVMAACEGESLHVASPLEAAWMQYVDARDHVADCEAKLALLDAYDKAMASGDTGYHHRIGRASEAESLWRALAILSGGYRQRDDWREHWPMPQAFQGN